MGNSVYNSVEPDGRNPRHTLLSSSLHLAHTVPSPSSCAMLGLLFWLALLFHQGRLILPKLTQRMKLALFVWLGGKAMRKQPKCEHSLETPEQFQTYKYITPKTWFISFLDQIRTWCISGLSNKAVNRIISSFIVATGPYFPRDPWYHYVWKSHLCVGWWAVRNTQLLQSEMGQLHGDPSQRRLCPRESLPIACSAPFILTQDSGD